SCTGCGVFTSTVGNVGSRIFNIEWRANRLPAPTVTPGGPTATPQPPTPTYTPCFCTTTPTPTPNPDGPVNFEVQLYEGAAYFDLVYGNVSGNGNSATIGVQGYNNGIYFTQYSCNTSSEPAGTTLPFVLPRSVPPP